VRAEGGAPDWTRLRHASTGLPDLDMVRKKPAGACACACAAGGGGPAGAFSVSATLEPFSRRRRRARRRKRRKSMAARARMPRTPPAMPPARAPTSSDDEDEGESVGESEVEEERGLVVAGMSVRVVVLRERCNGTSALLHRERASREREREGRTAGR